MIFISAIALNSNILETNLVNILILLGLIIYAGIGFFNQSVGGRRREIIATLDKLDNNNELANKKFIDTSNQFRQINLVLKNLEEQSIQQNLSFLESSYKEKIEIISSLFDKNTYKIDQDAKEKIRSLQRYTLIFAIGRVLKKFIKLTEKEQLSILNNVIRNLGENS